MCALSVVLSSLPGSPLAPIFRRGEGRAWERGYCCICCCLYGESTPNLYLGILNVHICVHVYVHLYIMLWTVQQLTTIGMTMIEKPCK